jgi:hypothetical protein
MVGLQKVAKASCSCCSDHREHQSRPKWLDEYADGIPVADGMMVEIGYLLHVIEAALSEGFVVADGDETE